jgi:CRP/FNR family cyclic AMP-dependent transcriptional regulator
MNPEQIRYYLRRSPLLQSLSEDSLKKLALQARVCSWPRGRVILRTGDPGNAMMIVVDGRVKIMTVAPSGRERILNIIEAGESFGEMALLDGAPRCADAEAIEPTTALVLGREPFDALLQSDPAFARRVIADLCARVRKATALVEDTLFLSPATRIARRLRAMMHQNENREDASSEWVLEGLSQQELADAVGLTRESVNRQLRAWQADGTVALRRRVVVVRDRGAIQRMACGDEEAN